MIIIIIIMHQPTHHKLARKIQALQIGCWPANSYGWLSHSIELNLNWWTQTHSLPAAGSLLFVCLFIYLFHLLIYQSESLSLLHTQTLHYSILSRVVIFFFLFSSSSPTYYYYNNKFPSHLTSMEVPLQLPIPNFFPCQPTGEANRCAN